MSSKNFKVPYVYDMTTMVCMMRMMMTTVCVVTCRVSHLHAIMTENFMPHQTEAIQ